MDLNIEKLWSAYPNANVPGWIYIVRYGKERVYKIGSTRKTPEKQLLKLQRGTPTELHLTHQIRSDNAGMAEYYVSRTFRQERIKNDWFALSDDSLSFLLEATSFTEQEVLDTLLSHPEVYFCSSPEGHVRLCPM